MSEKIDIGDYVHHTPSGEDWIVAAIDGNDLYWCGYPFGGSAELSDCSLIKKATPEFRLKIMTDVADAGQQYRPALICKQKLEAGDE